MKKVTLIALLIPLGACAQNMSTGEFEEQPRRPRAMKKITDPKHKEALLFDAVVNGKTREVRKLLRQGVNPNARDQQGNTPIFYVQARDAEIFNALIEAGADVNAQNNEGVARLHIDVVMGRLLWVKNLMRNGADVNLATNTGITPLHLATMISYFESPKKTTAAVATLFTGASAVIASAAFIASNTVIATATFFTPAGAGAATVVVGAGTAGAGGAAGAAAGVAGITAEIIAIVAAVDIKIRSTIVMNLIRAGAKVNAQDDNGNTPLHTLAAGRLLKPANRRGGIFIAEKLLGSGADLTIKNNARQTPYDVAREYKRYPLALVLYPDKAQTVKQKVREALEYIKKTPAAQRTIEATEEHVIEPAQKAGKAAMETTEEYVIEPVQKTGRAAAQSARRMRKQAKRHAELLREQAQEQKELWLE